ncbi:hypothetical protein BP5796_07171 [Coleophoma crateriformis]|uniref:Uncharacterized protein n=1 Tax=Coleophoma crateriformis TaxID=565419 RepID=A0A3D8RI44_9HELO|nr:hypothetical protein BP5796_07171 [Coleophoma crateriformis]
MPVPTQLSIELSNIPNFITSLSSVASTVLALGRDLRKSGSDIIVEEDLANVFGRGKVETGLESQFKSAVKSPGFVSLHAHASISLQSGPGPTVLRALREKDRRYLSTVIQLSFLGAIYDRTELATSIVECLHQRIEDGIEDTSGPGFEDVVGTLEACSSQTSAFNWQSIISNVENRIRQYFSYHERSNMLRSYRDLVSMTTATLLAAMDYFVLIQSLPEDRKMFCRTEKGVVALVVWAHEILGLTVVVRAPSKDDLVFGTTSLPQVIINWRPDVEKHEPTGECEVLLLDRKMKVVLECMPTHTTISEISAQERHHLESIGSTMLLRKFREHNVVANDDPIFLETIEWVIALTIITSRNIRRRRIVDGQIKQSRKPRSSSYSIEVWRIMNAAKLIFNEHYSRMPISEVDYSMTRAQTTASNQGPTIIGKPLADTQLPRAVSLYVESLEQDRQSPSNFNIRALISKLVTLIFVFSHVVEIKDCGKLSLCLEPGLDQYMVTQFSQNFGKLTMGPNTIFNSILKNMKGPAFRDGDDQHAFLISDFGWSVFLDCVRDTDPSDVNVNLIHIKPGVPTNHRNERKSRIRDSEMLGGDLIHVKLVDQESESYTPRCERKVLRRSEFYSSRQKEFWLGIGLTMNSSSKGANEYLTSYRELHEALWEVETLEAGLCEHPNKYLDTARLGIGVATFYGDSFHEGTWEGPKVANMAAHQRICICLVRGDQRARWKAVNLFSDEPTRQVMLRGENCCDNCALDAVVKMPGRWILIL